MEKLYKLNFTHLTLKPSVKDAEKFKGFTPFIINWIFKKSNISFYSISEELGENGGYHLDILIFATTNIDNNILNNKGKQIGLSGHLKEFMVNNLPSTQWGIFYKDAKENIKNEKEHNVKKLIGYNQKETQVNPELTNWNNLPITEEQLQECIEYNKIHNNKHKKISKDVICLDPKNAMFEMKKYLTNQEEPNYHKLVTETIKKGYCWLSMSEKMTRKLILQLKLIKNGLEDIEEDELNEGTFKKFENMELEQLKMIRHYNCPKEQRLKMLYEYEFISKNELESLLQRPA